MQTYVIPDVHGHLAALETALERIEKDGGAGSAVVFLGDYIDRGPDSRGVLQCLIDGVDAGRDWTCLRGNHDQYMLDFLTDGVIQPSRTRPDLTWLDDVIGGDATLGSYGIDAGVPDLKAQAELNVPATHHEFLDSLLWSHQRGDLFFAHAGIRPGVPLDQQDPQDLIWIRQEFLKDTRDHGPLIVHGHTAVKYPEHKGNRVNLDGGTGWGRPLRPAVFEGRDCWLLEENGRVALTPET